MLGWQGHRGLRESKWWSASAAGVPHCQNDQFVVERRVVDVVTTARQEDPPRASDWRSSIGMPDVGCRGDQGKRSFQFVEKEARRCRTMLAPPFIDRTNVIVGFRSGSDVQVHPLRRSSSMVAAAGRSLPACADVHDFESVS